MKLESGFVLMACSWLMTVGCSSNDNPGNSSAGAPGSAGSVSSAGATNSAGGTSSAGRTSSAGDTSRAGSTDSAGATAAAGSAGTSTAGGSSGTAAGGANNGGAANGGGANGGAANGGAANGGAANGGVGGASGGNSAGAAGASGAGGGAATSPMMSFFVSSRGPGMGGNLGGLTGADAFCKTLATAVSAELGAKTWHAYLSTATVNARTRIGEGPWRNAAGVLIANNLSDLHDQLAPNAALNATWPVNVTTIALDERRNEVPIAGPNVHDILTGSNTDGTVAAGLTCNDWTSAAMTVTAQVGHSNRFGGNRPESWNSAHATTGCAQPTAAENQPGTVSSGGGRGSIFCFAVP